MQLTNSKFSIIPGSVPQYTELHKEWSRFDLYRSISERCIAANFQVSAFVFLVTPRSSRRES